jgi:hypothetical protein
LKRLGQRQYWFLAEPRKRQAEPQT